MTIIWIPRNRKLKRGGASFCRNPNPLGGVEDRYASSLEGFTWALDFTPFIPGPHEACSQASHNIHDNFEIKGLVFIVNWYTRELASRVTIVIKGFLD